MIGTRLGAALALILAVAAVALAAAALMTALRDDDEAQGRLVQTRLVPSESPPILFPLDEFYASTGEDGLLYGLYVYPPGFFGHNRGCRIVWSPEAPGADPARTGAFLDPCGGARFARDGRLIEGEADRGLDRFETEPSIEGVVVDTRTLYCGPAFGASPEPPSQSPEPASATPQIAVPSPGAALASASPTATVTATPTPSATATASATPQAEALECDRVSPDAE